jgi:hypothetical protein
LKAEKSNAEMRLLSIVRQSKNHHQILTKEQLKDFFSKLESENSKDIALFEINQYGGGPDESFVKANKEGLQLFALELLKASLRAEELATATEKKVIHFEYEEMLANSDIGIHYIEPTLEKRKNDERNPTPKEDTWKDKLTKAGCITVALLLIIATGVGLIEMVRWLF